MQLKIKREERKKGLIFKKVDYVVETQLIVTEEETMAIKKLQLDGMVFIQSYEYEGIDWGGRTVDYWYRKGVGFPCATPLDAQSIENEIKGAAKMVKEHVEAFLESGAETETEQLIEL